MNRYAFRMRVRAGLEAEYLRRHQAVWPDVIDACRAAGIRNYSIFMDGADLFGYLECDDYAASSSQLAADPAIARWRAYMEPLMSVARADDTGAGTQLMTEVFHTLGKESRPSSRPAPDRTFGGIWPVLAIPFRENGDLDELSLRREIEFELAQGVDGLVVFGLASENYKLSDAERVRILDNVVSAVDGQVPVIAGTEHSGTEVAAERSHIAQELGASGVMLFPPSFVKPDRSGVLDYYRSVAARTRLPIMVQDAQTWTQVPLPVDLLVALSAELPQVRYVKVETLPTAAKMAELARASGAALRIFGGYGGLHYIEEATRGAIGTLIPPAVSDCFVAMHRALARGDTEAALGLHTQLLPFLLFQMSSLDALIEIQKHLFHEAGIFRSAVMRRPHVPMDAYQLEALRHQVSRLSLAIRSDGHGHGAR